MEKLLRLFLVHMQIGVTAWRFETTIATGPIAHAKRVHLYKKHMHLLHVKDGLLRKL